MLKLLLVITAKNQCSGFEMHDKPQGNAQEFCNHVSCNMAKAAKTQLPFYPSLNVLWLWLSRRGAWKSDSALNACSSGMAKNITAYSDNKEALTDSSFHSIDVEWGTPLSEHCILRGGLVPVKMLPSLVAADSLQPRDQQKVSGQLLWLF